MVVWLEAQLSWSDWANYRHLPDPAIMDTDATAKPKAIITISLVTQVYLFTASGYKMGHDR